MLSLLPKFADRQMVSEVVAETPTWTGQPAAHVPRKDPLVVRVVPQGEICSPDPDSTASVTSLQPRGGAQMGGHPRVPSAANSCFRKRAMGLEIAELFAKVSCSCSPRLVHFGLDVGRDTQRLREKFAQKIAMLRGVGHQVDAFGHLRRQYVVRRDSCQSNV